MLENVQRIKYVNLISVLILHVIAIYGIYDIFYHSKIQTFLWVIFMSFLNGFGVTAGAHRLWSHKSYKAILPFRLFLALAFTSSGQNSIYDWVRDHRVHHKHSDTNADPHNITRGFWFSHVGWLCMNKHKEVIEKGKQINMDDILKDPVAYYQLKFFGILRPLLTIVIPTIIPIYFWHETFISAFTTQLFRIALILNFTWSVNSFAHLYGDKPFDKNIHPVQNKIVSIFALGEGWHNYHHVFPYDYRASELGTYINFTTCMLDLFSKFGIVYDMKRPSDTYIQKVRNLNIIKEQEEDIDSSSSDDSQDPDNLKQIFNIKENLINFEEFLKILAHKIK